MTKLPNGWEVKKLGDICKLYQPKTITMNEIKSSGKYKVYGANGVIGYYDEYNHENSEVAMACRGATCGYINYTEPKSWITGNAMIITPLDESVYKRYLIYALPLYRVKDIITGSAQPQITRTNLSKIQIPLPPLEEQKKIVKILDEKFASIDESIRLAKDDLLSLDELWQSILNDSFNPLKSKLDNDTYTLPPTWKWEKLGDILSNEKYSIKRGPFGSALKKDFFAEQGIRVFEQYNPINNDPHWRRYYISQDKYEELKSFTAKEGDLLVSCSGTLGKIVELPKNTEIGIINQALLKLRLDFSKIINKYFIYYFISPTMQDKILENTLGSAIKNIAGVKVLKELEIPLPPLKEQERIAKELESKAKTIKELKELYTKRLKDYEELKESLLDLAFKGGL